MVRLSGSLHQALKEEEQPRLDVCELLSWLDELLRGALAALAILYPSLFWPYFIPPSSFASPKRWKPEEKRLSSSVSVALAAHGEPSAAAAEDWKRLKRTEAADE